MLVVNLFGAPGSGKSTGAAYIFSRLKMRGVNAELVTEFAKDKVWEGNREVFKNQAYIFGKQSFKLSRIADQVDVAVTDCPLLLSSFYCSDDDIVDNLSNLVMDVFNKYDNFNAYIRRSKPYNPAGRFQTEEESDCVDKQLRKFLSEESIAIREYPGDMGGYELIASDITNILKNQGML